MKNEIVKIEYESPEIIVEIVEDDIITLSIGGEDKFSWVGPIVP